MSRFYLFLWLKWLVRVISCSVVLALILASIITFYLFLTQTNIPTLDVKVFQALKDIFSFWFVLSLSITLLIALFRSVKYIFNQCIEGYELKLLECGSPDIIEVIGYGDLVKVWRKWFLLLIWLVASMMVVALFFTYMLSDYTSVFEWFNIFWLFGFTLIAGYFSFIVLISKCKRVKLVKC